MVDYKKHGQGTHSNEMGADKLTENTPNVQKCVGFLQISMKKGFIGRP